MSDQMPLKPVVLEVDKQDLEYVSMAEQELTRLMEAYPHQEKLHRRYHDNSDSPATRVAIAIRDTAALAWAYERFPIFDLGILSLLRKQRFKLKLSNDHVVEEKELELFVPALYWCDAFYPLIVSWNFTETPGGNSSWHFSSHGRVSYNPQALQRNMEALGREVWLTATCASPTVPLTVKAKAEKLRGRFDSVHTIFEAAWDAEIKRDPFVVGMLGKTAFLIDHFDLSNYEKYILSEHVTKSI